MAVHKIPVHQLSAEASKGVIEEFISRDETDYGASEASLETKLIRSAILLFDDETETTGIFPADDPLLKKLDP